MSKIESLILSYYLFSFMFADRMKHIHSSGIRKVFDLASKVKDPTDLSIGQPDFFPPHSVKLAMKKAIDNNMTSYTKSQGIDELREEILKILHSLGYICDDVLLTSGVTGALFLTYGVMLDSKDEMIVFDPYFPMYTDLSMFLGAKVKVVKTNKDFSINFDRLEDSISKKTKAIMFNSPNNPTGHVASKEEIKRLVEIAKNYDLWIFSDEIYSDFVYKGEHISPAMYYDKVLVMNGFSKNYSLTGMRLGYVSGPSYVIDKLIQLQQYTFVCPPSVAQWGVLHNLDLDISNHVKRYADNAKLVYSILKDKFDLIEPQGAFYAFVRAPIEATKFVEEAIKNKVLIIPGSVFSKEDTHFRISFATSKDKLMEGLEILSNIGEKFI